MALGWQSAPTREWNGSQWVDMAPERWQYWDGTQFRTAAVQVYADIPTTDNTPPVVAFTSPAAGATISGTLHLTGTVTDGGAVAYVTLSVGVVVLGNATITGNNWAIDIDTSGLPNGNITLIADAADTVGNATTVTRGFLVNNVTSGGQDQTGAYVDPTLSSSTATTISSGTLVLPTDSRLKYGGGDTIQDPGTFPGEYRPDFIKGTTATIPPYIVYFDYAASAFELYWRTHMSSEEVRFAVNGKWKPQTTTAGYRTTLGSGVRGYTRVDFGSASLRSIRVNLRTWFSGIRVGNNADLTASQTATFKVVGLGDSLTGGTHQGSGDTSLYCTSISCYFLQTMQDLGWGKNAYNESIGGSGFTVNGDGGGAGTYLNRTPLAINARNPNVVLLDAHALNDYQAGRSVTQVRDALIAVLTSIRNALPNVNIIVALTPLPPAIVTTAGSIAAATAVVKGYNDAERAAAAPFGCYVIDPLDGNVYDTSGNVLGNPNGDRWQMPTGQTYPSTYMTSDGVHPTREGSWILANQVTAAIQLCVTQASWRGPRGEVNAPADTSPPTVPTLQTPTVTATSMTHTWTVATDPSGIAGYNIYLSGSKQNASLLTSPTYTKTGLTANTSYGPWEVTAVDASPAQNESGRSNQVTAKTDPAPTDTTPPTVPGNFTVVAANGGWTASWSASSDPESLVAGYKVYDGTTPKPVTTLLSYTATGYPNGTPVSVSVSAVNGVGLESAKTTPIVVTPTASTTLPFQPANLTVVPGHQQLRVTWDAPTGGAAPVYYNVYFAGQKVAEERLLTIIIDQVPNGTAVAVQVAAVDANGNEGPKTPAVTDTPVPASTSGSPTEVRSYGPNGTHWPDRTPWLRSTTATIVQVACSWSAIKTAIQGLSDAQVNAGVIVKVAPGQLPGNGGSAGSSPVLLQTGKRAWRKRVLVMPRDGRGTVTFSNSINIKQCYNIAFCMFDMDQSMGATFVGCSYSALCWSRMKSSRITGLGGFNTSTGLNTGECTDGFDCVEVCWPYYVTGDLDPVQWSGGDPGAGTALGGNGWMRYGRFIGCYIAPQIRPIGGTGHNDGLQLQSGGGYYFGIERRDCATWASSNSAFQLGGWSNDGAPGNAEDAAVGPIRYFSRTTHCLDLTAVPTGQIRYPYDPALNEPPTSSSAYNGIGRNPQHYATDVICTGGMYSAYLQWATVTNSRCTISTTIKSLVGTWQYDSAILSWTAATWNRICPIPDENRLNAIWGPNPPAAIEPIPPAFGQTS